MLVAHKSARFLLARLHVDSLLDKRTEDAVETTLEELSSSLGSLNEAYQGAIKRIEAQLPGDSDLAKRTVSWITYAQRLLP